MTDTSNQKQAKEMLERFRSGESKSALEVEYWNDGSRHGKRFTAFVKRELGIDTERRSRQTEEVVRLSNLLRRHGVSPSLAGDLSLVDRLVANARQAALSGIRLYNDPSAGFRTETFIMLMIVAWNSLFQARLEDTNVEYRIMGEDGKPEQFMGRARYLGTWELAQKALDGRQNADIRANIDFFLQLRHLIEHRYLPAVDAAVVGEAQSMLLNFEEMMTEWFGTESALGAELVVPLQLSYLRSDSSLASLKRLQAELPVDVMDFLSRHRKEVPAAILRSHRYAMQLFFVPVAANRERSADAVVNFFRPGEVPAELEKTLQQVVVVPKPNSVPVAAADLYSPTEVTNLVAARIPFRFTLNTHAKCWRFHAVRPPDGAEDPRTTTTAHCVYDKLSKGYGYTQEWVELLVGELSDPKIFTEIIGSQPKPV